jgi:hypothetical protein
VLTRDGDYKREPFEEGATRLLSFADQFLDDYLGPQIDPDDPDSRWRRVGCDPEPVPGRTACALCGNARRALLDMLNRRDEFRGCCPRGCPTPAR